MPEKKNEQLIQVLLNNSALDLYKTILQEYPLRELFSLARQTEDYRLAFRAAWTLEHIFLQQKASIIKYKEDIITLYASSANESSLRSISKLIIKLLQIADQQLTDDEQDNILEKTFHLIEQEECPVALLVNCWDILHLLSAIQSWIRQELKLHITFSLEKNATPASKSRGLRILKKLERIADT
ncbi:MAG TPA: hypothetical protein PKA53_02765 [Sphingobacterium sp.]|nr:hypothetical protein [Sphingobacterium sp.]